MAKDIAEYIRGCAQCQQMKINTHPTQPQLTGIPANKETNALPYQTININFITDLPESNTFDALLVIIDHDLSKAMILAPCNKTTDAIQTANLLFDYLYKRFGLPKRIISDRGTQFASKLFQELCKKLHIDSRMSTAYHPQTNGGVERTNQEIEAYLRIYCTNTPNEWTNHLTALEFAHNSAPHSTHGQSPFKIILGYNPTAIPDNLSELSNTPTLSERLHNLNQVRKEAEAAHELARQKMSAHHNRNFKPFNEGQMVWLEATSIRIPGKPAKLSPK